MESLNTVIRHILQFLDSIHQEKDMHKQIAKGVVGIIGDLVDTLGNIEELAPIKHERKCFFVYRVS